MKIQDVFFFIVFAFLIWKRDPRWSVVAGLISLIVAIPLFATWTFFTAEHLTWYAAAFLLLSVVFYLWQQSSKKV